jgi:hypothetical protein
MTSHLRTNRGLGSRFDKDCVKHIRRFGDWFRERPNYSYLGHTFEEWTGEGVDMDYQAPAIEKRENVIALMFNPDVCDGPAAPSNPHCNDGPGPGPLSGGD